MTRISSLLTTASRIAFVSECPKDITVSTRLRVPAEPRSVTAGAKAVVFQYDAESGTVLDRYPGAPEGIAVSVEW